MEKAEHLLRQAQDPELAEGQHQKSNGAPLARAVLRFVVSTAPIGDGVQVKQMSFLRRTGTRNAQHPVIMRAP